MAAVIMIGIATTMTRDNHVRIKRVIAVFDRRFS